MLQKTNWYVPDSFCCAASVRRGEPHRYGGPDTGNVLTWTTVYSPNHTAFHGDMDKKLKPKPLLTHTRKCKHINLDIQDRYTDKPTKI